MVYLFYTERGNLSLIPRSTFFVKLSLDLKPNIFSLKTLARGDGLIYTVVFAKLAMNELNNNS